ncbi:MAG: cation:proton antiporter [Patescibacteria group bacterium]
MNDVSSALLLNISLFLLIPFLFTLILKKFGISSIVGCVVGGLFLGNLFSGFISRDIIANFAYIGIVLLMFTVGLEIQFSRMMSLKKYIVMGGFFQMSLTIVATMLISLFSGFSFIQSLLIGIALSSSSISLMAKIIQERGEEGSFHGELAMGILMFQNLAFIPFLIFFNSITQGTTSIVDISGKIFIDIIVSGTIIGSTYYFGNKAASFIFSRVANISRELLNLCIILIIFLIAYIFTIFHIHILVSAFVAGIAVSQTLKHYHIFSQIRPMRNVLSLLFTIYIGINIQIGVIFQLLPKILIFACAIIVIKAVIILITSLSMRLHSRLSLYLSLFLFQIDEGAFILISLAYFNKMFTEEHYYFLLATIVVSIFVTAFLVGRKELIYNIIRKAIRKYIPFLHLFISRRIDRNHAFIDLLNIKNHIVICGYGRIGSYVGRALMLSNIPFIAIDYNFEIVEKAKKEGVTIIYGDPTDIDILDYAQVKDGAALVTALPDRFSQETIILNARKLNKDIIIIGRAHKPHDHKRMRDMGVKVVIQPEFEASLSIIKKLLLMKKINRQEIIEKIHYFKLEQEGI